MTRFRLKAMVFALSTLAVAGRSLQSQETTEKGRIPPGQSVTESFPILYIADVPEMTRKDWSLKVLGKVKQELSLDWVSFLEIGPFVSVSDFHCVTGWTRLDNHWKGVRIRDILALAGLKSNARFVTFSSLDGYTTSLPIAECTGDDDLLAFEWEGEAIENARGGPVRAVIPAKYGYKSAMWISEMKLTKRQELGYWEKKGYHNHADPWKQQRTVRDREP